MKAFGFSLNNLTLFGLVLAIGIVVDDAIVVVENVERYLRAGMSPRDAAHKTMDEVGGALVAIALVLCAVFIPTAFITGISGAFYRQFAVTITASTIISAIVSLTLSPALAALLLRPHGHGARSSFWSAVSRPFDIFFAAFNRMFEKLALGYGELTRRVLRVSAIMLVLYVGLIGLTYLQFARTPSGFIPPLDRGYFIAVITLPPGSSLERTDRVVRKASDILTVASRRGACGGIRRFRRRHLHRCSQFRRGFRLLEAVRGTGESQARQRHHPQRSARPDAGAARGLRAGDSAALRPRHRHRRRFQALCPGPRRARSARARAGGRRHHRPRQPDARPGAGVHAVQYLDPADLRRHRPHQGRDAGRADHAVLRAPCRPTWARPSSTISTFWGGPIG